MGRRINLLEKGRLAKQINFIIEVDKLKSVYRQTSLIDKSRRENDAEHSWHLLILAMLLNEYANDDSLDISRVMQMVAIHDIVEIDAGDTFAYDRDKNQADKLKKEREGAKRIFALLPKDQGQNLYNLWEEFEEQQTPEAKFASALDRIQPLLHNYYTQGGTWLEHNVDLDSVIERFKDVAKASKILGQLVDHIIKDSIKRGYIKK